MKRSEVIAKVQTYKDLSDQNLLSAEVLEATIQKGLADGTMKALPISVYTEEAAELLEFAQAHGLVRSDAEKSAPSNGEGRISAGKFVAEQYPDFAAAVAAVEPLTGKEFEINVEGVMRKVAFQPFWRTVKPKTATAEGETTV